MPKRQLKNKTIDVILLQDHKHLGEKYEVVKVKPIYAKNVLLPQGIVTLATADMLYKYRTKMEEAQKRIENKKADLQEFFDTVQQGGSIVISRKVNEKGILYDKVDAEDVAKEISNQHQRNLNPHHIKMKKITTVGETQVTYKYKDIEKSFNVVVKAENDTKPHTPTTKTQDTSSQESQDTPTTTDTPQEKTQATA